MPSFDDLHELERRGLLAFVRRFPQVHQGLGLLGNALFVTGSVLFLLGERHPAILAFLAGSIGMFVGQLGEILRGLGQRRLERYVPADPGE